MACVRLRAVMSKPLKSFMRSVVRSGLRSVAFGMPQTIENITAFGCVRCAPPNPPYPPIGRVPLLGRGHRPLQTRIIDKRNRMSEGGREGARRRAGVRSSLLTLCPLIAKSGH